MKHSDIEPILRQIVKSEVSDAEVKSLTNAVAAIDHKLNKIFDNYVDKRYSFQIQIIDKDIL